MDIFELIKVIILTVTASGALLQIVTITKSFNADHERRKKQATIEYLNNVREKYTSLTFELINKFGSDPIGVKEVKEIRDDHMLWYKVKFLLGQFEHLAAGVNTKVFDIHLVNRASGSYVIGIFEFFSVYIYETRKMSNNNLLYSEYEDLVNQIKSLRLNHDKNGDMEYS